jgi:hypothetical protein
MLEAGPAVIVGSSHINGGLPEHPMFTLAPPPTRVTLASMYSEGISGMLCPCAA